MKDRTRAFTLVELLIALAITSVLVVLLVNVVSATLNIWQQGHNQVDTFSNSRQALSRIAEEIKGAVASSQVQFAENISSLNTTSTPSIPAPQAGTSENVFFVAPHPNSADGDLCVIAYRLNSNTHALERALADSQTAWSGGAPNRYQATAYTSSLSWRPVATGVLEFEVLSYSKQNLDNNSNPPVTWDSTSTTDPTMTGNVPRQIIIRIKVVDDKSLVRLNVLQFGSGQYNQLVTQAAREFRQNVSLLPPH